VTGTGGKKRKIENPLRGRDEGNQDPLVKIGKTKRSEGREKKKLRVKLGDRFSEGVF